jgi:dTDP-4-dehydrorhamnose reductase
VARALIFGAGGQLAQHLVGLAPSDITLKALSRNECDITDKKAVARCVESFSPDVIINAAAYTAVDRAESEPERAYAVNSQGARNVAEAGFASRALVAHISTDYVFDGVTNRPYLPTDQTNPLNVYGASKAEGERGVLESGAEALVLRTSWLYSAKGQNFLLTMLRLMRTNPTVRVVSDQVGCPSASSDLATAIWRCVTTRDARGVLHWTNSGTASWFDFANSIQELALERSILSERRDIVPIATSEYPTAAKRPAFSVLDSSRTWELLGRESAHWKDALGRTLDELRSAA